MNSSSEYHRFFKSAAAKPYGFNGLKNIESIHKSIYVSIISLYLDKDFFVTVNRAQTLFLTLPSKSESDSSNFLYSSFIFFIQYVTFSKLFHSLNVLL